MEWWHLVFVFGVGFVASTYGVMVGGGGLLTVPALLWVGLPVVDAVATTRLGSLGVSVAGLYTFFRAKKVDWNLGISMGVLQIAGTILGTWTLVSAPVLWVRYLIAGLILFLLFLFVLFPAAGLEPVAIPRDSWRYRSGFVLTFFLGILTGFFQGGGGTLATYIMVLCFGQTFLQSAGTRKLPFLIANVISLAILFQQNKVHLLSGGVLMLGAFCGGWVGSRLALKKGNRWMRMMFVVMVAVAGISMLFQ
ncbi:MAG: sulfite exporter TauE/SafE family protein [Myxococcota bacterium]